MRETRITDWHTCDYTYNTENIKIDESKCIALQDQNRDLRTRQETETTPKAETPQIEMFDFKAKFAETKAHAKVRY